MSRYPQPEAAVPRAWRTVGGLIDAGVDVYARCHVCRAFKLADIAAIAARRGRDFSLCDMRVPCRTPRCWGWVTFSVHNGMRTESLCHRRLHDHWLWDAPDRWRPSGR